MRSSVARLLLFAVAGCGAEDIDLPPAREDGGVTWVDADSEQAPLPQRDAGTSDAADASAPDDGLGRDPRLQPGTGIDEFIPLEGGETLRWEAGPQGGFHVYGAARVVASVFERLSEGARDESTHTYLLENGDGEVIARTVRAGRWARTVEGYVARGVLLVLEPGLSPYRVSRSSLIYTVSVDVPGESVRSSIRVQTACCD